MCVCVCVSECLEWIWNHMPIEIGREREEQDNITVYVLLIEMVSNNLQLRNSNIQKWKCS